MEVFDDWVDLHDLSAVLFADLDRFILFNDEYGHPQGDLLLIELANRLQTVIETRGLIARTGGNEFCVLLKGGLQDSVHDIATEILEAVNAPYVFGNNSYQTRLSIGAVFPDKIKQDKQQILINANKAMASAKAVGGHCLKIWHNQIH